MSEIANNSSNETTKLSVQVQKLREAVIRFADDLQLEAGDKLKDVYKETQSLPAEIEALEEKIKWLDSYNIGLVEMYDASVADYNELQTMAKELEERLKKKTKLAKKLIKGVPLGVSYVDYKKLQTKLTKYQALYDTVGDSVNECLDWCVGKNEKDIKLCSCGNQKINEAFQAIKKEGGGMKMTTPSKSPSVSELIGHIEYQTYVDIENKEKAKKINEAFQAIKKKEEG